MVGGKGGIGTDHGGLDVAAVARGRWGTASEGLIHPPTSPHSMTHTPTFSSPGGSVPASKYGTHDWPASWSGHIGAARSHRAVQHDASHFAEERIIVRDAR